jgi:hypothetical protein
VGRVASGKGAAAFGIMPLAVNVQIAGDCHGGNLLFCGSPSVPGAADGERERAVIAHFFAGIVCGSQHPNRAWRKKQRDAD